MAKRMALAACGAAVLAALTLGVGQAKAGLLGCNFTSAGQPFAAWGDNANYVQIPGGTFESGGWSLAGGAKIVSGNEPFNLAAGSHSLYLPAGSSAMTPGVCLGIVTPSLRFVGSASDGSGVHVTMYTRTLLGLVQLPTAADIDLSSSWDASAIQTFLVQNLLGLVNLDSANVYFKFTPIGGASVRMDDVFLDPYLCD